MKLLYIHDRPLTGSTPDILQVLQMCLAFAAEGVAPVLGVPHDGHSISAIREHAEKLLGGPLTFDLETFNRRTVGKRFAMLAGCLSVTRLAGKTAPDCIFTRNPVYATRLQRLGVPLVFEAHDARIHAFKPWNAWWRNRLVHACRQRNVILFVTISHNLGRAWVAAGVPENKILAVHDGVDTDVIRPAPDPTEPRRRLKLPPLDKIVTYVGSLFADRGVDRILALAKHFPNALFLIVGGPPEAADALRQQAGRDDRTNVRVVGPLPHAEVIDYLRASDILLLIWSRAVRTIDYCSPLKVFESLAAGKILVAEHYPTIGEVLTDGKDSLLVQPEDMNDLRRGLADALALPADTRLKDRARELAVSRYSWRQRAATILGRIRSAESTTPGGGARP